MAKDLKDKAIKIKGKDYVLVSDRVNYFNEEYPDGSITTELVSDPKSEYIIVKATIYPSSKVESDSQLTEYQRCFTGYSQAVIGDGMVNKTAALENAETSSVGRALGFMGIGVIESIASGDEINKTTTNSSGKTATPKQIDWMRSEAQKHTIFEDAEQLDQFIEEILTVKPQAVPLWKVKDAVDKINEEGRKLKETPPMEVPELTEEEKAKVKDKSLLDDIPY